MKVSDDQLISDMKTTEYDIQKAHLHSEERKSNERNSIKEPQFSDDT